MQPNAKSQYQKGISKFVEEGETRQSVSAAEVSYVCGESPTATVIFFWAGFLLKEMAEGAKLRVAKN